MKIPRNRAHHRIVTLLAPIALGAFLAGTPAFPRSREIDPRQLTVITPATEKATWAGMEAQLSLAAPEPAAAQKSTEGRAHIRNRLIHTGVVLAVGYLIAIALMAIVNRRVNDLKSRHMARKSVSYVVSAMLLLYMLFLWARNINSLTIFLGIASVGLALALQEVILCAAGWINIVVRRPFEVGDRIEMGGVKGDVIDIRLVQTSLLEIGNWVEQDQSTGRIVNIPNSMIFKKENFNYNKGFEFIWNEIKVLVTFESDWKRVEGIMLKHARAQAVGMEEVVQKKIHAMTRRYMIHYDKLSPIVYVSIRGSGIELALRYLTQAKLRRTTHDALSRAILDDFAGEKNVHMAGPAYKI